MLSSKEGFSFLEGLDMDAISDITGISIGENSSHHSGSVGSDNTELLLNENVSLRELDGDDSFLDSVSQVDEEHDSHHKIFSSSSPKRYHSSNKNAVSGDNSLKGGMSNDYFSRPIIAHDQNSFQDTKSQRTTALDQKRIGGQSTSFVEQEFSPKSYPKDKLTPPKYLTKKYPSDTNIESCGRRSVIKHHSHISSVKPDVTHVSYQNGHDLYSNKSMEKQRYINGQDCSRVQQVHFHSESFETEVYRNDFSNTTRNFEQGNIESSSKRHVNERNSLQTQQFQEHLANVDHKNTMHSHEKILMYDPAAKKIDSRENFSSCERYLNSDYQERCPPQQKVGPVGNEQKDVYHGGLGTNEKQEMLLGVKHDPDTNELYDDKVREGANLLSRIFGGDHSGSFNSLSSTSRGSENSRDQENTKSSSLHGNRSQPIQRSTESSLNNETKIKTASPAPRKYAQLSQSDHKSVTTPQRVSYTFGGEISVHSSGKERLWDQDQTVFNNALERHPKAMIVKNNEETQEYANVSEYIKNDYIDGREDNIERPVDPSLNERSSLNFNTEVSNNGEIFQGKVEELKILELDIEEIHSRKKMTMDELKVLEESLDRNKADMKSSEDLVEQYRWQATQTRSELMELEKTRNQLQEECNAMDEIIEKSKQNKSFNNNDVMFGRSKDEIFTSLQERDKFKKELELANETLKREKERANVSQNDLREKIRALEDDLSKQHRETVGNINKMKEQLKNERQTIRNVQHQKLKAVNNLRDEMKELQEKEIQALRAQMLRERSANVELVEEKFKREANHLKRAAENAESRIKQMEASFVERNEEISKLRHQQREEKQKNLDIEKQWRAQLESERQDAEIRLDEQERSCKNREIKLQQQHTELENLVEERTAELRRSEERCSAQTEELQKIIETKNEEIKLVRGLVRQQEDATRVLGERLRSEAREHVRNAVEKERQSLDREKDRIGRTLEEEKEKNTRTARQFTEQLEMEKESHSQTKLAISKLKQESEELRKNLVEVHGERITGVQRARQEGGVELEKIKEKLHEFTLQAEKLERSDRETAKAIYEECRKIVELVDMPVSFKTPTRIPDGKPDAKVDGFQDSPTKEALASLQHCNSELRQRLSDMKKEMGKQRVQNDNMKQKTVSSSCQSDEELTNLQTRLEEKEEEIQRLHKEYGDEILNLQAEKKKELLTYKRTVAKLEQEFQKLINANVNVPSFVRMDKRDITPRNTTTTSNGTPNFLHNSALQSPAFRSTEKASSADLLKNLQERVKKLRAENENLKKSSDKDSSFDSVKQTRKVKWLDNSDSVHSQNKRFTISQLGSPVKSSQITSRLNSDPMNGNIEQMARLQKLLSNNKKDDPMLPPTNAG